MDDDQGDAPLTRDEMREKYGWASEEEREAAYAEVAERQRKIDSERILAECLQAEAVVTKDAPVTQPRRAAAAPASLTREWTDFIEGRIRQELRALERVLVKGIAPVLVAEEKEREKVAAELAEARSMINALTERIDKLEAAPRGLRAVVSSPPSAVIG